MSAGLGRRLRRWLKAAALVLGVVVLIGATYQGVSTAMERRNFPRPGRLVQAGTHQLHIHCTGAGSPTVVLEAPAMGMSSAWGAVQTAVARVTRVCSYDRSGLGWSEWGERAFVPGRVPLELHALLQNAQEEGPFVLAGEGLGAAFVRLYASRFPDDVAALVLIDDIARGGPEGPPLRTPGESAGTDAPPQRTPGESAGTEGPPLPTPGESAGTEGPPRRTPGESAVTRPSHASPIRSARLTAGLPWLARIGLLRVDRLLNTGFVPLPQVPPGAMQAFLNRPDHLTRAGQEIARWDDTMSLASRADTPDGLRVMRVDSGSTGTFLLEPAAISRVSRAIVQAATGRAQTHGRAPVSRPSPAR